MLSAFFISNAKVIVIPIEEKKHTLNIVHTHTLRSVDVKMVCASYRMTDGDNFVVVPFGSPITCTLQLSILVTMWLWLCTYFISVYSPINFFLHSHRMCDCRFVSDAFQAGIFFSSLLFLEFGEKLM